MAILFKQLKRKERIFTWMGIISVIAIIFLISLFFFPPYKGTSSNEEGIFSQYDVKIDLGLLDSDKVKNLDLFSETFQTQFTFTAQDNNGKQITGTIAAQDENKARSILTEKGLTVVTINESSSGKTDPFYPYYKP